MCRCADDSQYYNVHTCNGPSDVSIQQFVEYLQAHGSVKNQNKGNSGHPPSVTKDQGNIDLVRDSAIESPKNPTVGVPKNWRSQPRLCGAFSLLNSSSTPTSYL